MLTSAVILFITLLIFRDIGQWPCRLLHTGHRVGSRTSCMAQFVTSKSSFLNLSLIYRIITIILCLTVFICGFRFASQHIMSLYFKISSCKIVKNLFYMNNHIYKQIYNYIKIFYPATNFREQIPST